MRKKTVLYLVLSIAGLLALAAAMLLEDGRISDALGGALCGIGAGAFAFGFSNWRMCRREEKNPALMRQKAIEEKDERNILIRNKAGALSGEVLQWLVLAGAWVSIAMGAPLWVSLAATGLFLVKSIIELVLILRYQKEM